MQKDNTCCKSGRIATDIKDNNNRVLCLYIGGGAVDHEQSYLLGGVVVTCKHWRWAALVYAAARIVGLACNNSLGPLNSSLVIPMDGEDHEVAMVTRDAFQTLCNDTWGQANRQCCNEVLVDHTEGSRFDLNCRVRQSEAVGTQLAKERETHEAAVKAFLDDSHVDG